MMKGYVIDHASLVYLDSVAMVLHDEEQHDPLDAVLILTDVQSRAFHRERWCGRCENWAPSQAQPQERDSTWVSTTGRPRRPGSREPLLACGNCILGKLDEVDLPDPKPLSTADRLGLLTVQAQALAGQLQELERDPERWQGRIQATRERLHDTERRVVLLRSQAEVRSGKRRVLVQSYVPTPGRRSLDDPAHVPIGPAEEHWERVSDWDPEGLGSNRTPPPDRKTRNPNHHKAPLGKCILKMRGREGYSQAEHRAKEAANSGGAS